MEFSKELRDRYKEELKDKVDHEITDGEADEGLDSLAGLFEILWQMHREDVARKRRLKEEPNGYVPEGGFSCYVCRNRATWYNKHGMLCEFCRVALDEGIIPDFVPKQHKSYFMSWQIKSTFKVTHATMKKYIKDGILKPRTILGENGRVHEYIFLRKENLNLIERDGPARKSYDRKKRKMHKKWARESTKELVAEHRKEMAKIRNKYKVIR
jgi:predicted house-cleaning noncanonical NTP pyrophosphatase (MazG superfamily)